MRFLPMLIGVYCLFFFGFSTMITPAPIGVAKTPFLKHMLQQEPSESQNISKENTSLHQKAKKKQGVKTKIPNFIYVLIETICQCGGKKVLNFTLPKHIKKTRIAGSLQFIDALSFTIGSIIFYGGIYTILLKKEMLLMHSKSLFSSLSSWLHESPKQKIPADFSQNEAQSDDDSNEIDTDSAIHQKPSSKTAHVWAPPYFIK